MIKKSFLSFFLLLSLVYNVIGQIPPGYYNNAIGLSGLPLKVALHNIIKNHTVVSYASLFNYFQTTDDKPNGYVWDMYSDIPGGTPPYQYTFASTCGTYNSEGDCYNREHSFPQSWFNSAMPMSSDLFHIYPTDGYVNGERGNNPYGEVSFPSWTSQNGSKVGSCTYPGYTGTVFEPINEYKGDFARSYFYMATRYYTEDTSWPGSPMVNGAEPVQWAMNMLLAWSANDTVSQKEIDRNNTIYGIQNNRNPFIDHPEYANEIWGNPLSVSELDPFENVSVDGNPGNGIYVLTFSSRSSFPFTIDLFSSVGQIIYSEKLNTGRKNFNTSINISTQPNGIYYLRILSEKKLIEKKIVKM